MTENTRPHLGEVTRAERDFKLGEWLRELLADPALMKRFLNERKSPVAQKRATIEESRAHRKCGFQGTLDSTAPVGTIVPDTFDI